MPEKVGKLYDTDFFRLTSKEDYDTLVLSYTSKYWIRVPVYGGYVGPGIYAFRKEEANMNDANHARVSLFVDTKTSLLEKWEQNIAHINHCIQTLNSWDTSPSVDRMELLVET